MRKYLWKSLLFALFTTHAFGEGSWYEKKLEGWYYFDSKDSKSKKKSLPESEDVNFEDINTPELAEKVLEIEKKKLQQKLALALLSAKPEHVQDYMAAQKAWVKRSETFALQWGHALLKRPDLSSELEVPTTSFGIQAKKAVDNQKRKELCQRLSKDHFFLLFFRGEDPFAYGAYKTARAFAALHGWQVRAVSLDGKSFQSREESLDFEIDRGLSRYFNVEMSPAFFAVQPGDSIEEARAYPIGIGLISVSDLEKNIELQLGESREN